MDTSRGWPCKGTGLRPQSLDRTFCFILSNCSDVISSVLNDLQVPFIALGSAALFEAFRFRFVVLAGVSEGEGVSVRGEETATALSLDWKFVRTGEGGEGDTSIRDLEDFLEVDFVFLCTLRGLFDGVTGAEINSSSDISETSFS